MLRLAPVLCVLLLSACRQPVTEVELNDHAAVAVEGADLVAALDATRTSKAASAREPFVRLGVLWDAAEDGALELRVSSDGVRFGPWMAPTVVHHEDVMRAGHVDAPQGSLHYQWRVPAGRALPTFIAFDPITEVAQPGLQPKPELEQPVSNVGTLRQALAPNPTINSRASWGARAPTCSSPTSPYRAVVHHTVTPNNDTMTPEQRLRNIQAYHMDSRGYCDIAYNYLVSLDGRVWMGRGATTLGGHTANNNTGNVAISFLGDYTSVPVSQTQLCSGGKMLAYLNRNWPAITLDRGDVKGHREYGGTSCPGDRLYPQLAEMISKAQNGCEPDADGDSIPDAQDNCDNTDNVSQTDTDKDGKGDACDTDDDNDGDLDTADNCRLVANASQLDTDSDSKGDACDTDDDNDGDLDTADNCRLIANADQADTDKDGQGNACDGDDDADGVLDAADNCPLVANVDQTDTNSDSKGDACQADDDADGVPDATDNCRLVANASQSNVDGDAQGDACDADLDGDGLANTADLCPSVADAAQTNTDGDAEGDACDADDDDDSVDDAADNCALIANPNQENADADAAGDACDADADGDGVSANDNCALVANPDQTDADSDGLGDACDEQTPEPTNENGGGEFVEGSANPSEADEHGSEEQLAVTQKGCAATGGALFGPLALLAAAVLRRRRG